MFLNKRNLFVSFCLLTSFISAVSEFLIPRFTKKDEKYLVHLYIDDAEIKLEKCLVESGYQGDDNYFSKKVLFEKKKYQNGDELIIDISDIPKDLTYTLRIRITTDSFFNFKSWGFAFYEKEDIFVIHDIDYFSRFYEKEEYEQCFK